MLSTKMIISYFLIFAIINSLIVSHFEIFDGFDETINFKIILGAAMTLIGVGIVMIREKGIDISPRPWKFL